MQIKLLQRLAGVTATKRHDARNRQVEESTRRKQRIQKAVTVHVATYYYQNKKCAK